MLLLSPEFRMSETIYLYRSQTEPKVKLTCVKQSLKLQQLIDFFHNLQDLYNIQFTVNETITENLLIECANIGDVPWYIIEYDEILNRFCIWQNDNKWNLNKIINKLYKGKFTLPDVNQLQNEQTSEQIGWEKVIGVDKTYLNHPLRDTMKDIFTELNFNWRKIDMSEFWEHFNKNWVVNSTIKTIDDKNRVVLKSVLKITLLKLMTQYNKIMLKDIFNNYYTKMNSHCASNNLHNAVEKKLEKISNGSADDDISSNALDSIMSSVKNSPSLSPLDMKLKHSSSGESYVYHKLRNTFDSNLPTFVDLKGNNKNEINSQLYINFKKHFKEVVEDYEIFELRTRAGIPIKMRSKSKSGCISKS